MVRSAVAHSKTVSRIDVASPKVIAPQRVLDIRTPVLEPPAKPVEQPAAAGVEVETTCRSCGCAPAVPVSFRQHRGYVVFGKSRVLPGPLCRECGLALFRDATSSTLVRGWWSFISPVMVPLTVAYNALQRGKIAGLASPQRTVATTRRPLEPGLPLLARPTIMVTATLIATLIVAIVCR